MSSDPLISVIIPAFNAEETLADTLNSALASEYRNIEIIVVDDGSTDATHGIAASFAESDARVKLITRENGGPAAAFNTGLATAQGDYIARVDADDLWHPRKLLRQVAVARADPALALIFTWIRYIDCDGRVVKDGPAQRFAQFALRRVMCENIIGGGSSVLMKAAATRTAGGYDESLRGWEDLLLHIEIAASHRTAFVSEYLVGYRTGSGSLSRTHDVMLASWRRARSRMRWRFRDVPQFVHRWAHASRCMHFTEAFAWCGNYRGALALAAEAAVADPRGTAEWAADLLRRRLRRRQTTAVPGPTFWSLDPKQSSGCEASAAGRRLRALQRKRIDTLEQIHE